jgi:hypothetical protein
MAIVKTSHFDGFKGGILEILNVGCEGIYTTSFGSMIMIILSERIFIYLVSVGI